MAFAFTADIRKHFVEHPRGREPRDFGAAGREAMREIVRRTLHVLGSAGKAVAIPDALKSSG